MYVHDFASETFIAHRCVLIYSYDGHLSVYFQGLDRDKRPNL